LNDCLQTLVDERRKATGSENVRFIEAKVKPLVTVLGSDLPISSIRDTSTGRSYIERRRAMTIRKVVCDRTIQRELEVLLMALGHAKGSGKWSGDLDNIIPPDFKPAPPTKGDSITRSEAVRIFKWLTPDASAAVAFSLATGAEMSALHNALRQDIPGDISTCRRIFIRGTKNPRRAADVAVVTDEQRLLLAHVQKHARGVDGKLFRKLSNLDRELRTACRREGITVVSPHDIRRTAGQWMIDLGAPLEIVSLFLRHREMATTQRWYAQVRDEDVADRLLDALDPRLAAQAHKVRGEKKLVETITSIPPPHEGHAAYAANGVTKSLDAWATDAGIPKTTLFYRVVKKGLPMAEALALGPSGRRKRQAAVASARMSCDTGVTDSTDRVAPNGQNDPPPADTTPQIPPKTTVISARHRRFEPLTYGSGGPTNAPVVPCRAVTCAIPRSCGTFARTKLHLRPWKPQARQIATDCTTD
jgi:integrase